MGLTNKQYYEGVMDQYKKTSNRLIRASKDLKKEIEKYDKTRLQIFSDVDRFCDAIEKIQNRPQFSETTVESVKVPLFSSEDLKIEESNFKKLMKKYKAPEINCDGMLITADLSTNGIFGSDLGMNHSVLGVEMEQYLNKLGSFSTSLFGKKREDQIYKIYLEVKKIEKNVDEVIPKISDLKKATNQLCQSIVVTREVLETQLSYLEDTLKRTVDYSEFQGYERDALKNSILLMGLLYQISKVRLLKKDTVNIEEMEVNEEAVSSSKEMSGTAVKIRDKGKDYIIEKVEIDENSIDSNMKTSSNFQMTSELADELGAYPSYALLNSCAAYYDDKCRAIKLVDYEKLSVSTAIKEEDDEFLDENGFAGSNDEVYYSVEDRSVRKNILYKYNVSSKKKETIESDEDAEFKYLQANENWLIYKKEIDYDEVKVCIYRIKDGKIKDIDVTDLEGYYLYQDSLYIQAGDELSCYSLNSGEMKTICKLDNSEGIQFSSWNSDFNALIEGQSLYIWHIDNWEETISLREIDLETGKKKRVKKFSDECPIEGKYYDGYIYYIKEDEVDSLCRVDINSKKKEVIVKQTDTCSHTSKGVFKKEMVHVINMNEVKLQKIGDCLYYRVAAGIRTTVYKVELDNDFYLSELQAFSWSSDKGFYVIKL